MKVPISQTEFSLHNAYNQVSEGLKAEVIDFWEKNGAVPNSAERERRANELVCVARNDKKEMVGIATAYIESLAWQNRRYQVFTYRTFIRPEDRKSLLFVSLFFGACKILEEAAQNGQPSHVLFRTENKKFMGKGVIKRVFEPGGATFIARNPAGQDVWAYPLHRDGYHRQMNVLDETS